MLQVKSLCKQYTNKKKVVTNALDNVSLTFPETGMVFILGKSGSGKSTLLNVCGGLDRCTSGEIVIRGKSSADFSPSDFDSYRNTYVGFVFQEYNILEDFTVEENIALALELQNKPPRREVIDKILADVEMTEFATRKPNTLSGGQKQRVAIARALVKEPQIIMADEPTGALDSQTGQQVFDTLKRLSRDKLVLVVSHDHEFAEQYGDRIIELKDGRVISDVVRTQQQTDEPNVTFYGGDTVCVRDGASLTDREMDDIKQFLSKSVGSAVITTSRDKVAAVHNSLPQAKAGVFEQISEQPQTKQYSEQKLIRSKLPLRHAVKMGASSLKTKPVRLAFTILLSVMAFVLFGLASTLMLFSDGQLTINALTKMDDEYIILQKNVYQTQKTYQDGEVVGEHEGRDVTLFTYDEYKAFKQKYPRSLAMVSAKVTIQGFTLGDNARSFYSSSFDNYAIADDSMTVLAGRLPTSTDEIAITDFMFDAFRSTEATFGYYVNHEWRKLELTTNDYNQIVYSDDKPIVMRLNNNEFKIVGVVKGGEIPEKFSEIKKAADENRPVSDDYNVLSLIRNLTSNGMYNTAVVTEEFILRYAKTKREDIYDFYFFEYPSSSLSLFTDDVRETNGLNVSYCAKYEKDSGRRVLAMYDMQGNRITNLNSGSIVLAVDDLRAMYSKALSTFRDEYDPQYNYDEQKRLNEVFWNAYKQYENDNPKPQGPGTEDELDKWTQACNAYAEQARLDENRMKPYLVFKQQIEDEAKQAYAAINPEPGWTDSLAMLAWQNGLNKAIADALAREDPVTWLSSQDVLSLEHTLSMFAKARQLFAELGVDVNFKLSLRSQSDCVRAVEVVGIIYKTELSGAYFSDDLYDVFCTDDGRVTKYYSKYAFPDDAYISRVLVPKKAGGAVTQLVKLADMRSDDDTSMRIDNFVMYQLAPIISIAHTLSTAFLISGLSLALFAFLLMFNFISVSIASKKREIGILRAIGARIADVFKIFLSEALIISAACFVVSVASTAGLCVALNSMITEGTGLNADILIFGPLSVLCILAIAAVTAVTATIIPVARYGRKPPVESIRSL